MKKKLFFSVSLLLVVSLIIACQKAQEGVPSDISYVPISEIKVENVTEQEVISPLENVTEEKKGEEIKEEEEITPEQPEKETEEKEQKAIVIIAQETDFISLKPVADDPDKDKLSFTYSSPLNSQGEWQTTYGDAGEYTVTITASDGELTTSKDALLVINKKEEPPTINKKSPDELTQNIRENTKLEFKINATDLNKDTLTYEWKLDGKVVSTQDSYTFVADYDTAGSHTVKADISDGTNVASALWSVTVLNVDRTPVLKVIPDITVRETENVVLKPEAFDPDEDVLNFTISEPIGNSGIWQTTYDDAGIYNVNVTVSDGELQDTQVVKVTVINVNRPPVIENIIKV